MVKLSKRQTEILTLIAAGYKYDRIGEILNISSPTVNIHLQKTRAKLGAKTNAQAVAIAIRENLI